VKADTYVLETNVHYPTDVNLLYDSGRKCLDTLKNLEIKSKAPLEGWRKLKYWRKALRNRERALTQTLGQGGRNRAVRVKEKAEAYLETARNLSAKIKQNRSNLLLQGQSPVSLGLLVSLDLYRDLVDKHIDLVERRLIKRETIPHQEKLFSIFEQHTEWISKGKKHKKFELGHNVLIATDQYHFILHHKVAVQEHDVTLAVPLAKDLCQKYDQDKLGSISFDRGFYSLPNYENLQQYAHQVILPKKGNKNGAEQEREHQKDFVKLRHKHSAVEANINQLEHHGLNKCPDRGLKGFKRYAALGVLAYNLHRLGKILLEKEKKQEKQKMKREARKRAA